MYLLIIARTPRDRTATTLAPVREMSVGVPRSSTQTTRLPQAFLADSITTNKQRLTEHLATQIFVVVVQSLSSVSL